MSEGQTPPVDRAARRRVVRNGLGIGIATGAYGVTFGALSVAAGLSVWQTCVLSLAMFTGGSQFAFVGVVAGGGSPWAATATAILLGSRNGIYGVMMAPLLAVRGLRRAVAAQLTIDESTAVALGEPDPRLARVGFWSAGLAVFTFWNLFTLLGAVGAELIPDPQALGLDAVAPAAFIALVAPRLTGAAAWQAAIIGGAIALVAIPLVAPGLSVIVAAVGVLAFALWRTRPTASPEATT